MALPLLSAGVVLGGGCAASEPAGDAGTSVIASMYPLAYVAQFVGGDAVRVTNLTAAGAEPHDLELSPRQVGALSEADLIVYLGGFQPAVDEAVEQASRTRSLDVATVVDLTVITDEAPGATSGDDPHFWLDPTKLAELTERVTDDLSEIDPGNAEGFRLRAETLTDELAALDAEYASGLATCERRAFVTSHAAFGHLAARYDLDMVGISGLDPEAEPSPARLAEVQQIVEREGITTIFHEPLVSPKVAEVLATDLGLQTAVLDPIEGLTEDTKGQDYQSLMRANLQALQKANGCT